MSLKISKLPAKPASKEIIGPQGSLNLEVDKATEISGYRHGRPL